MGTRLIAIALLGGLLSGCASAGNCAGWDAIRPSKTDRLSEGTASQILKHNRFGATQCGWKPGR